MRSTAEIEIDIKINKANIEKLALELENLVVEKFYSEFEEVEWDAAEKWFCENESIFESLSFNSKDIPTQCSVWTYFDRKHVSDRRRISIHKNEDGTNEMWIGGYKYCDNVPRDKSFFVNKKYAEQIKKAIKS